MNYDSLYLFKDIIIVGLIFGLIGALLKVRTLKETLVQEKRKRTMPLITMDVNLDDDFGVFLVNDSYCYARNINIDDLDVVVDYGFKKHITLAFDPLEVLKPSARVKLNYRVLDDGYDITRTDARNILHHFANADTEMHLRYENIEGGPFTSTIRRENNQYIIKDAASLEQ